MVYERANDFLTHARASLRQAEDSLKHQESSVCISRARESIEFSTKSALIVLGVDYSGEKYKPHDVSGYLERAYDKFPDWFQEKLRFISLVSKRMALFRIYADYGDELWGIPSSKLFSEYEAKACLEDAKEALKSCERLLDEHRSQYPSG